MKLNCPFCIKLCIPRLFYGDERSFVCNCSANFLIKFNNTFDTIFVISCDQYLNNTRYHMIWNYSQYMLGIYAAISDYFYLSNSNCIYEGELLLLDLNHIESSSKNICESLVKLKAFI